MNIHKMQECRPYCTKSVPADTTPIPSKDSENPSATEDDEMSRLKESLISDIMKLDIQDVLRYLSYIKDGEI